MTQYRIDPQSSTLTVTARSSVHDTETRWQGITGIIDADLGAMESTRASIEVDMRTADAGDWLKNRKLRKDMDFDKHPTASFAALEVSGLQEEGETVRATLRGSLRWRGKSVDIEARGEATITEAELLASGSFELDVTRLGIKPPRVLMIKVDDVVSCAITLRARAENS